MEWTRDSLISALAAASPAETACRAALRAGSLFQAPRDGQALRASELVTTYSRRERHLEGRGIRTIGFAEALDSLRTQSGEVAMALVYTDDLNFIVFLNSTSLEAVACLAVDAAAGNLC